jgi:cytoskeletal protein CcmA (bactofilin family)
MSSVLAADALILGNVSGQGDLEIRGKVQGNVVLTGRVAVARGGSVLGKIEAVHVSVHGEVRGDLVASDGVSIGQSGDVEGQILAPRVAIEAGARVRGHLRTGSGEERAAAPTTPQPSASGASRPAPETAVGREEGESRGRRRRRKRGGGQMAAAAPVVRSDAPAHAGPVVRSDAPAPRGPAPAPRSDAPAARREVTPRQEGPSPQKPPPIPTFVKGAHGHRRDN